MSLAKPFCDMLEGCGGEACLGGVTRGWLPGQLSEILGA